MKTGIVLPQFDAGAADLLGAARLAEEAGLDSVWVSDNLWGVPRRDRPVLEAWTSLAAVAASTSRITVGTLVLRTTVRNRRVLLSMAQSVALVAPGRFVLGLGIGDSTTRAEQRAFGLPYPPADERAAELRRHLELFRAELPGVPVWVGGGSRHVMDLIPEAAGWNYWGTVDGFARRVDRARELSGDRPVELSWAGLKVSVEELHRLAGLGAAQAIVAAGARNYREKVAMLAGFARS
ncbi:MAG TPA: LLM class flavin-dependent oxidoreductase [Actinomycetota bacterium]|nr:LLM class flavin-dependent oxidoreductase [Actinomycetota bacterium]